MLPPTTVSSPGCLVVHLWIVEAQQIPNIHDPSGGPPFAYAKVKWNSQKYKTDINKTHRWEKAFSIPWRCRQDPSVLEIEVWSSYPGVDGRHVPIGSVPIDLRSLRLGATSCAYYKLMKASSCPSFGQFSPALKLRIEMLDPESARDGTTKEVGVSNKVDETVWFTDSNTPRKCNNCDSDAIEEENSQLIDQMSRENPSSTRNEILLALRRAKFDPIQALHKLDEIMSAKFSNLNNTDSSSEESSYESSTSSTEDRMLLMSALSPDEMIRYDETVMLAKRGDKNAEKSVKQQKKEIKRQQKQLKKQDPINNLDRKSSKKNHDKERKKKEKKQGQQYSPEKTTYQVTGTTRMVSAPIEDRLQELFPYYSIEQIKKVLIKHNFHADAALDELLETRFDELGQTLLAHGLSPANSSASQEMAGMNHTYLEFKPHAKPLAPRKPKMQLGAAPLVAPPAMQENSVPDNGIKKALLIGIDYIGTDKALRGCIEDTTLIRKMLTSVYMFPDDDSSITVLTDDNPNPTMRPTKENILIGLQWLVAGAKPGSFLFFHYSGHGSQQKDSKSTEMDGMDETIIPLDYTKKGHITDDELNRLLVAPLKTNVKLVCLMDCCHSGSGMDLPFIWNMKKRKWDLEFKPRYSTGDVQLISGCSDDETSAEFYIPQQECGGAMTRALRHSLSLNPFGHTYGTLMDSITNFLRNWGFRQTPKLSSTQNFAFDRPFGLNSAVSGVQLPSVPTKPKPKPGVPPIKYPSKPPIPQLKYPSKPPLPQFGQPSKHSYPPMVQPGKPIVSQYHWPPQQQQQQQPIAAQYNCNPAASYKVSYDHSAVSYYQQHHQGGFGVPIPSSMPQPAVAANHGYAALYSPRLEEPLTNHGYVQKYSPRLPEGTAPANQGYAQQPFSPRYSPLMPYNVAPYNTSVRPPQHQNYRDLQ